ncbi:MAG: lipopolysaccharide heptosyltransferase II [Aquificae bacterium]|nr:lipopolysaccharide heptosyltransferase II [Aquificota bacterium]
MKIVIWQTAFLGDLILTTPMFHSIKNILPQSSITVVAKPFGRDVLKNNPYIDQLILFDKKRDSILSLIKQLRRERFDIGISPHRSHRASYTLFLSGIPERIGFDKAGFSFLYTKRFPHRFDGTHEIDRNLSLLKGLPEADEKLFHRLPELFLDSEEEDFPAKVGLKKGEYILIAPGSKWGTKRWTAKGFGEVIDRLLKEGETVVLLGGKEDIPFTQQVIANTKNRDKIINLCGKSSLRESFGLVKGAKALISNDSAPVHMAVAFGTPVVDIYGATVPEFGFYPYRNGVVIEDKSVKCRPCSLHGPPECPIKTHQCMENITADMVLQGLNKLLKG